MLGPIAYLPRLTSSLEKQQAPEQTAGVSWGRDTDVHGAEITALALLLVSWVLRGGAPAQRGRVPSADTGLTDLVPDPGERLLVVEGTARAGAVRWGRASPWLWLRLPVSFVCRSVCLHVLTLLQDLGG